MSETANAFHQYDEDLTDEVWDLQVFETAAQAEEPETSPEELVQNFPRAFQDSRRMLVKMAVISGHQSGYKECPGGFHVRPQVCTDPAKLELLEKGGPIPRIDFVDEEREAEREEVSQRVWAELGDEPAAIPPQLKKFPPKPVRQDETLLLRIAAEIGAKPANVHLPRHIRALNQAQLNFLLDRVKTEHTRLEWAEQEKTNYERFFETLVDPAKIWNRHAHSLAPRNIPSMRFDGTPTIYRDPNAPVQPHLCGIRKTFKDQSGVRASAEWKELAEQGKIKGRITQCKVSEQSLIQRSIQCECGRKVADRTAWEAHQKRAANPSQHQIREGLTSWQIGPNIQGMGLHGARIIVELAALNAMPQEVLAEIYKMPGFVIKGKSKNPPELVQQLMNDADAWAILAANTNHPKFGRFAKMALAWRNRLYLKLDEFGLREMERIGAKVARELEQAYPEEFAAAVKEVADGPL